VMFGCSYPSAPSHLHNKTFPYIYVV